MWLSVNTSRTESAAPSFHYHFLLPDTCNPITLYTSALAEPQLLYTDKNQRQHRARAHVVPIFTATRSARKEVPKSSMHSNFCHQITRGFYSRLRAFNISKRLPQYFGAIGRVNNFLTRSLAALVAGQQF